MLIHRSKQHAATGQHPDRSLTITAINETPTDRIASTGDRRSDGSDSPPTTGTPCAADRRRNALTERTTRQAMRPALSSGNGMGVFTDAPGHPDALGKPPEINQCLMHQLKQSAFQSKD